MDIYKKESKHGSKGLWFSPSLGRIFDEKLVPDCKYFPSILEFKVYKQLVKIFGDSAIKCHKRVTLVPEVKGRNKAVTWDIDFHIADYRIYVEAKGSETPEYKIKRELFRHFYTEDVLFICKNELDVNEINAYVKVVYGKNYSTSGA